VVRARDCWKGREVQFEKFDDVAAGLFTAVAHIENRGDLDEAETARLGISFEPERALRL